MSKKGDKPKRTRITAKRVQAVENKPIIPNVTVKPEVDDEPWGDDGLTTKQRLFVEAYVGPAGGNATRAAEMAGYSAENRLALRATGWENLTKPYIQRAISHALARKKMSPEWAKERLAYLASGSMTDFLSVDENGDTHLDFKRAAEAAAIGHIKEYYEDGIDSGDGPKIIKRKIKLHDPAPALVTLLKIFGLIVDKHEHGGAGGGPIPHEHTIAIDVRRLTDEQLSQLRRIAEDVNLRGAGIDPAIERN